MKSIDKSLLLDMLHKFGEDSQIDVTIEEMAELTKELLKYKRSKVHQNEIPNIDNIAEEMADVSIMLEYLKMIFSISDSMLQNIISMKLERTKWRYIDNDKETKNN